MRRGPVTTSAPEMIQRTIPSIARVYVGRPLEDGSLQESHGSGFCIGSERDGGLLVVTNAHVIGPEEGAKHALAFGERGRINKEVELVGWHPWADIAVLRVDGESSPEALRFHEHSPRIGEDCYLLGYPWTVDLSVTRGIVSGLDRDTELGPTRFPLRYLQSDTVVHKGNSGGPLVNREGVVVGVAARGIGREEQEVVATEERGVELMNRLVVSHGLNLFVPCDSAAAAVKGILDSDDDGIPVGKEGVEFDREFWKGFLSEPFGGVMNIPDFRERPGVVAVEVEEGSPADKAGIRPEDSIVRIDEMEVDHPADLYAWRMDSGSWQSDSIVTVWRGGDEVEFVLRAEESRVDPDFYVKRLLPRD